MTRAPQFLTAHEVLRQPEVVAEVRRRWGAGVIDPDGKVDRRALAAIVFRRRDVA